MQKLDVERRIDVINRKREMLEAQIAIMRAEFSAAELDLDAEIAREDLRIQFASQALKELEMSRTFVQADTKS
jgi:hypothetical protein